MKFEEPIINIYKIKTENVAWGDLYNPSGTDDDEVEV